jgi:prolyl-tRNA synthetase
MRQSQLLIPTMKETPADAEVASHQLMLRAGLIRQLASGLYSWLPLGVRVLHKIEAIVREELNASAAQEILMPVVQPAELWEESGRWDKMGPEMLRMQDRHDRAFCLGPTHEEVVTDIFRSEVQSYKNLPCNFYQIQTKFRDERRPRFGVMRSREFIMKDGYSFHADQASFDATYQDMYDCYSRIFSRMGIDFRAVEADTGAIGGANSHEFHALAAAGEDVIAYASEGTYAANLEKARAAAPGPRPAASAALEKVATPGQKTIADIASFLKVAVEATVKTLLVAGVDDAGAPDRPVALVLRGDHELNEIKASKLPGVAAPLRFATDAEIEAATGCATGSLGPVGLALEMYVDEEAAALADFVCGANETGFHLTGANWDRDQALNADRVADLRNVVEGDRAPEGAGTLKFLRGIEVGHIFQLGTIYSQAMSASVLGSDGRQLTPIMGCYGLGITRVAAAVIEQSHDDDGIIWPEPLAPFRLHVLALNYGKSEAVRAAAEALYAAATAQGIETLLDDRDDRPGAKFADADLLGLPHRIVIGDRGLKEGKVEYRTRDNRDASAVPLDSVLSRLS